MAELEYRIEAMGPIELAGIGIRCSMKGGSSFQAIPAFWDAAWRDGRCGAMAEKIDPAGIGLCGVCHRFDYPAGEFTYTIAIDRPASMEGMPAGAEAFTVPAATWAKFTCRGPMKTNFQPMIKRVMGEWLPASGYVHANNAEIEYYSDGDMESPDYVCEFWVPVEQA